MPLRRIAMLLSVAALAAGAVNTGLARPRPEESAQGDIWEDEGRRPRSWWMPRLSDEVIDRIMKGLEKRDPEKAKELAKLRKKDPEKFKIELVTHGRPELRQIGRERFEEQRRRERAEFLEWLKTNFPDEEKKLASLREKDAKLYGKAFEHIWSQFSRIFRTERYNPELAAVLKEDYELKTRRDELLHRIRHERSATKRQELGVDLQNVVARRYDLIVRQKEIAYEQLLRKLEELQQQIQDSRTEISKWKDEQIKQENVRHRIKALTESRIRFSWD